MRCTLLTALSAAALVTLASWPADAQTRSRSGARVQNEAYPGAGYSRARTRTRITVRRGRSFLDPGTEVLPRSQPYLDYANPPLWYPTRIWDTTGARRFPLPGPYELPGFIP